MVVEGHREVDGRTTSGRLRYAGDSLRGTGVVYSASDGSDSLRIQLRGRLGSDAFSAVSRHKLACVEPGPNAVARSEPGRS